MIDRYSAMAPEAKVAQTSARKPVRMKTPPNEFDRMINTPPAIWQAGAGAAGGEAAPRFFDQLAGSRTVSITWITPFDCFTSAMVTVATLP